MGVFMSSLGQMGNVMMMDTQQKIRFGDDYRRTLETAKAAGQLQTMQQANIAGSGGGGGASATGARAFGSYKISASLFTMSKYLILPFIAITVAGYFFRFGGGAMFASSFLASFLLVHTIFWLSPAHADGLNNFRNIGIAFVVALVLSVFTALFLYPLGDETNNQAAPVVSSRDTAGDTAGRAAEPRDSGYY